MAKVDLIDSFYAPPGIRNPHFQTIYPVLFRKIETYKGMNERLATPDGDFLDLVYTKNFFQDELKKAPIVFLFHGLEGDISSKYASSLLYRFEDIRWRAVFMHHRNCSKEPNRKSVSYHGAFTDDIQWVIDVIHKKYKRAPKFAAGFSIGGSMLLNYLIEKGKNPLRAAVAVSVPYDFYKTVTAIEKGFSKIYSKHLLRQLILSTRRKIASGVLPAGCAKEIQKVRSIIDYDNVCTAPLHGYRDALDYYKKASTRNRLGAIRTPVMGIQALDDPFMTPDVIPESKWLPENFIMKAEKNGGHVGFFGKRNGRYGYWLDYAIPRFFISFI